jgi:copper chaperone
MTNKKETILNVDGMTCSSCIRHVEAALRELGGIKKVEVRLEDGRVHIEHDPSRSTIDEMIVVLREAGYESRGAAA